MNALLISEEISGIQLREEQLKEGIIFAQKRIRELENNLLFLNDLLNRSLLLLYDQLKDKQRMIFIATYKILAEEDTLSINKISDILAKQYSLSFSTIKWNITRLRDMGLFESYGERGNTKTILLTTELGKTLFTSYAQIGDMKLLKHK